MKKKIELKLHVEGDELYRYVSVIGQIDTKFKVDREQKLVILETIFGIRNDAEVEGIDWNSKEVIQKAIDILRNSYSEYIDFKEWNDDTNTWETV